MAGLALRRASEPPQKLLILFLPLLLLLPAVSPGNIPANGGNARGVPQPKCVSFCKDGSKFGYQPRTTYRYNYRTDLRTFAVGAPTQESRIHLTAAVEITTITACEHQLELKDIRFTESHPSDRNKPAVSIPNSDQLVRELTERPLRYSFQDGKVEHICSEEGDYTWALNVKRGVLSLLQNTMDDLSRAQTLQESDISGKCVTRYDLVRDTQSLLVKRSKNLKTCSQRQSHISAIQSVAYASSSPVQNIPLLSGSQECTQTVRNRQMVEVTCLENHKFQPFERASSGVSTVVSQSLILQSSRPASSPKQEWAEFKKSGLIFKPPGLEESSDGNIQEILELLNNLESQSVPKVSVAVPELFIDLVGQLRLVNYAAITTLFNKAPTEVTRNFILDALPLVGTAPSLTFMREMFSDGKLSELQIDSWLTSISFIKHPRLEMIPAIAPLLEGEPRNQALLSTASVIHGYCQDHSNCAEEAPVQDALRKILSFLGPSCKLSKYGDRELTRSLFALKAIGNAGRLPTEKDDRSFQLLRKCFEDDSNPMEGRLAALDAFRRMPCDQYDQNPISDRYRNAKEETELRIVAYLVSMKCPNRELIEIVKDTLYTDSVNQVGSFVWTHLTNLQETSSPDKQKLKDLLSNDFLKNKFNTDARKFSRNYESSVFWEEANVGGGIDANVIFTPDSFLPRSTNLNITLYLFGESINLLEVGGRIHSFEQLLESVFGPNGYFPEPHVNEALNSVRSKRDTSTNQIDRLKHVFNQAGVNRDRLPGGSLFMRVFGNEISYKNFEFSHKQTAPTLVDENGRNWLDITYLFDNMGTGKSTDYIKSSVLMDARYIVPTAAGIPLSLGVQAAAAVGMKASGKIDLGNFWEEQELDIHGALEPSGSIQVDGHLTLSLGRENLKIKSGIKFQNILHSVTAVKARVLVKGTNVVHASLTLPQDKQEVLEAKSQLILISPTGKYAEVIGGQAAGVKHNKQICSPEVVSNLLGLKFCGSMSLPEMNFPLLKPAALGLSIEKTDTFNSYEFDYKWIGGENGESQDVSLLFNTPGSRMDRRVAVTYSMDLTQGKMEASIETPRKSLQAQGHYSKTSQNLQLTLRSDQEQILMVGTGLRKQQTRLEPHLVISYYSKPIVDAQGVIYLANILESDGKANFDLTLKHLTEAPIQLTGEVTRMRDMYNGRIGLESTLVTGNIRSQVRLRPGLVSSKAELQYSWRGGEQKVLNFGGKLQKTEKGAVVKYSMSTLLTSPQFSYLNTDFSWETAMARGFLENNFKLILGKSRWEGKTIFKNQFRRQLQDVQFLLSLNAPQNGVDYYLDLQHQKNQSGIYTRFIGRTDPRSEIRAQAEYLRTNEKLLKRNLNAEVSWPSTTYALRSRVNEIRAGEFEAELIILPNGGPQKKATLSYTNGSTKRRQEHALEIRAQKFLSQPIIYSGKLVASDRESLMTSQFELEGSGRWRGSFEYSASKRYAHKMEAKVDLNGAKYNAELNWRQARSGDQTYTADFHLAQHFYSELLLRKGEERDVFLGKLTVIPDKGFKPNEKVILEGSLTNESGKFEMDYFGQPMTIAGVYASDKVQFEAELDSKRLAFSLETPSLTMAKLKIVTKLETPLEGYTSLGFMIDHTYEGKSVNFRADSHLEAQTAAAAIYGNLDNPQSTFSIMLDGSGMEKLTAVAKMSDSDDYKQLEITTEKGSQNSVFKAEFTKAQRSHNVKMDFSGCSLIPEVSVEYNRQRTSEVTDNFVLRWTPTGAPTQVIEGRVSHLVNPFKVSFLVTSPWKTLDRFEGRFSLFESDLNKELKLYVNGPPSAFPLNLEMKCGGTLDEFAHSLLATWYTKGTQKSVNVVSTGRIRSLDDSELALDLKIPNHRYQFQGSSSRGQESGLRIESKLALDSDNIEGGLTWLVESGDNIQTSIWAVIPNVPKMILSYEHLRRSDSYFLDFSCELVGRSLATALVDMKREGWVKWDVSASLESPLNFLPDVTLSSKHDFRNLDSLTHVTEYRVKKLGRYWGSEEERAGVFEFKAIEGKLDTSFSYDTEYFHVVGEVDVKKVYLKAKATTELVPDYDIVFGVHNNLMGVLEAYVDLNLNGTTIYHWRFGYIGTGENIGGRVHIDCPWGHVVEAEGILNFMNATLDFQLKETKQELINLKLKAQCRGDEGRLEFNVDGKSLTKKSLVATYVSPPGKMEVKGQYEDELNGQTSLSCLGEFTPAQKKFDLRVSGSQDLVYTIEIHDNRRLEGIASHSGQKLLAITAELDTEYGEYAFGKRTLKTAVSSNGQPPRSFQATVGLDMTKFLLQLDTSFESWTPFLFSGELTTEGDTNSAVLNLRKNNSNYRVKVQSRRARNLGELGIEIETPWKGYQKMEYKGSYEIVGDVIKATVHGFIDTRQLRLRTSCSPREAEFDLSTPFDSWRKVIVSSQWNLYSPSKSLQVTAAFNERSHLLRVLWDINEKNGFGQVTLGGDVAGTIEFKYDLRKGYNAEASLDLSGKKHQVGGHLVIEPQEVRIELHTPWAVVQNFGAKGTYTRDSGGSHKILIHWNLNGQEKRLTGEMNLSDRSVNFNIETPFKTPWNSIQGKVDFATSEGSLEVKVEVKRGQDSFILSTHVFPMGKLLDTNGNGELAVKVQLQTTAPGWENIELNTNYKRTGTRHQLKVQLSKGVEILRSEVNMNLPSQGQELEIQGTIALPQIRFESGVDLALKLDLKGETLLRAKLTHNGVDYSCDGSFQVGSSSFKVQAHSSFPVLRNFAAAGTFERFSDTALSVQLNEKTIDLKLQGFYDGFKEFRINCDLNTPFEGYRAVHGEANLKIQSALGSGSFQFQNDRVRYMGKVEGRLASDSGEVRIQFNSPIYKLENVVWSLKFGDSKALIRLERNTKEDLKIEASLQNKQLVLGLISNFPSYPINTRSVFDWSRTPLSAQIHLDGGPTDGGLKIISKIQGLNVGHIEIQTPVKGYENLGLEWIFDGSLSQGNAKLSYDLPSYGKRSLRSTWKRDDFKSLEAEFWCQNGVLEKGLSLEYSWATLRNGISKLSGSVSYVAEATPQAFKLALSVKNQEDGASLIDFSLKTPFSPMEDLGLSGKVMLGREISIDLSSTINKQPALTFSSTLVAAPLQSSLRLVFNAPAISEPFTLNAVYNLETIDKHVEIFFAQNKYKLNVKAQAIVSKENPAEIELRMNVDSNIPSVTVSASASLRAGYKIESDGTRQVTISIDSLQTGNWRGVASIRPRTDFSLKFRLESPIPAVVPSVKSELEWRGSSAGQFAGDFVFQMDSHDIQAQVTLSSSELKMTLNSGYPGLDNILIQGKIESGEGKVNKKLTMEIRVSGKELRLTSNVLVPSKGQSLESSIELASSWEVIPSGSVEARMDDTGVLNIRGNWGGRTVEVKGNFQRKKNRSVWEAAESDLTLLADSAEVLSLQSHHFFHQGQYSWNLTLGPEMTFHSFLEQVLDKSVFSTQLKWPSSNDGLRFSGETNKGKFKASLSSPWTSEVEISGRYKVGEEEYSADGFVTYEGVKSGLRAELLTKGDSIAARMSVDVPVLGQKVDAKIHLQLRDKNNVIGLLEMSMGDRHVSVKGSLTTNQYPSSQFGSMLEQVLKMSVSIPRSEYVDLSSELTLRRPQSGWHHAQVEWSLSLPKGKNHKAAFRYDIPNSGQPGTQPGFAFDWYLDCKLMTPEVIKGSFEVQKWKLDDFSSGVKYMDNEFKVTWTLSESFLLDISADLPNILHESSPVRLEAEGVFDPSRELRLRSTFSANREASTLEGSLVQGEEGVDIRLLSSVPSLQSEILEANFKVREIGNGRTVVDLSGSYGPESFTAIGEFVTSKTRISASFKVSGSYGSHFVHLAGVQKVNGHFFEISAESQNLFHGKKIQVSGSFNPSPNGFTTSVECRTKQNVHGVRVTANLERERGGLVIKLDSIEPMLLETSYAMNNDKIGVKVMANMGEAHQFEMSLDRKEMEGKLYMKCPMVHRRPINAHARAHTGQNQLSFIGDLDTFGTRFRGEGTLRYEDYHNMELKFELITPFKSFDRITVGGKFGQDVAEIEFHTPLQDLPNFMIKFSGINFFESNDFHNFHPKLTIGLPFVRYSAGGSFQLPTESSPGKFGAHVEQEFPSEEDAERYDLYIDLTPYERFRLDMDDPIQMKIEGNTPIEGFRHLELLLGGNVVWRQWGDLIAEVHFNEHKISLTSQLQNDSGNQELKATFTSPFQGYEEFGLLGHIQSYEEIGAGHNIQVEIQRPGMTRPLMVEIDYRIRYNGPTDMDGELKVSKLLQLPPISLRLRSDGKESKYAGLLEGTWGTYRPVLKIDGSLDTEAFSASIEGKIGEDNDYQFMSKIDALFQPKRLSLSSEFQLNYDQLFLFSTGLLREENLMEGEIRLKTPFEVIRSASALYRLSPTKKQHVTLENVLKNLDITAGISYNDRKVIHVEIVNQNSKRLVEIHNPFFRPVSIALGYDLSSASNGYVVSEVCWDLTRTEESTLGVKVTFNVDPKGGKGATPKGINLKVHAGRRGFVEFGVSHMRSERNFEQVVNVKWNQPKSHGAGEAGYLVRWNADYKAGVKKEDFTIRLDFPVRSVELSRQTTFNHKEASESAQIRWDAKRDTTKTMGYKLLTAKSTAWRSSNTKLVLKVIHSALPHDLTLTLDRRFTNFALQGISILFEPSSFPKDALTFEFRRDSVRNKELRMLLIHPATNLDVTFHLKESDATRSLFISHVDMTGQKQLISAEVTSDIRGTFVDAFTADGPLLKMEYQPPGQGQPRISLKTRSIDFEGEYTQELPLLKGGIKYESGKEFTLLAGLPHSKEISLKIDRNNFGRNIRDLMVAFKLNASQILSTQIHWRPEIAEEFRTVIVSDIPRWVNKIWSEDIPRALSVVNDEIEERLVLIDPSLTGVYAKVKSYSRQEIDLAIEEVKKTVNYLQSVHEKNWLYTKNVEELLRTVLDKMYTACSDSIEATRDFLSDLVSGIVSRIEEMKRIWNENGGRLESALMPLWGAMETKLVNVWHEQIRNLGKVFQRICDTYETIGHILDGNLAELEKTFKGLGVVRKVKKIYKDYIDWIKELPMQEYINEACEMFKEMVWRPIQLYYQPYLSAWNTALEEGNIAAILEMPPIPYLRFVTSRVLGIGKRFWIFVEAEQKIKSLVGNILARVDSIIQSHLPTASLVFDLEKGHIEYHQPLTLVQWNHFNEFPTFKELPQNPEETHRIQDFYFDVLDTMRSTRPVMEMDMRDILPPFDATAIIAGDHHFLTFDQTYYRFLGECSYILVTDLLHQNLTLLVNYENTGHGGQPTKKSYSLITGPSTVEIETDTLAVTIDGRKSELPVTVGSTFIRRQPSGIEVIDTRGFQMKCSQTSSVCRVSISGWYFGKVGGLLGNYDHEKSNDLRTPDGHVTQEIANFAHSWRVGPQSNQCQMKNYADKVAVQQTLCNQMLNNTMSPLRPCFKTVDVEVYKKMCEYDVMNSQGQKEERMCTALSAYVMQCQQQGIDIWMPPQCVKCKLNGSTQMRSGENMTYSPEHSQPPTSADVVFLIEEASSLREYNLADTMKKLEAAFRTQGIDNNRYGIIGFGGKGGRGKPHIRTSNNDVWSSMATLKLSDTSLMDGNGKGDLYEAIDYAATIGYRAGVSKTIIAILPGKGQCQDNVRYSDALTLLLENDIRLHILAPEDFSLKVDTKQDEGSKIFGVDMEGAFTVRHVKRGAIEGDRALRRQVRMPKDLCTPLAMETTGSLFNLKMVQRPAMAKKFVDVWSRRVASTSKPSDCQLCDCVPDRDGGSMTLCHPCISPNLQKFIDDLNRFEQNPDALDPAWIDPPSTD